MKSPRRSILLAGALLALIVSAFAVRVGEPAPGFTAVDSNSKQQHSHLHLHFHLHFHFHLHA